MQCWGVTLFDLTRSKGLVKNSIWMIATGFAALIFLPEAHLAGAAEIKVLSAAGMRPVMEDLGPKFERATGHKLALTFGAADAIVNRMREGVSGDVVISPLGIETLAKDGKVAADSINVIARARLGVAVRKGAAKPDISSSDAFKRTLLAAKSITYLNPAQAGDSGFHFVKVLDRLGITNEMKAKTVLPKATGAVSALIVDGEVEIAVLAVQHILFISVAGIEFLGPLPPELQETMVFSAAIMTGAKSVEASKALMEYLRTREATMVITSKGMDLP